MCPILHGGRKPVKVKEIKRGEILGSGGESIVFEATATVKKKGKTRAVKLAEKQFFGLPSPFCPDPLPFRSPCRQFKIMTELKRFNNTKKLGLHILPTIRLTKRFLRRSTLLLTRYKKVTLRNISSKQHNAASTQQEKEKKILKSIGYDVGEGAWKLIEDPITKEPTYYLADFGHIRKIPGHSKQ